MKTIQVKYLQATVTKPTRLKAFTDHQQIIISVHSDQLNTDSEKSLKYQVAELLANKYNLLDNSFLVYVCDGVFCITEKL